MHQAAFQPVPGFERSAYRLAQGRIVWAGDAAQTDHPRHALRPWRPPGRQYRAADLRTGAALLRANLAAGHLPASGLLVWLLGQPLPFPWQGARVRLDALAQAVVHGDRDVWLAAAQGVLGLGPGLTPSGDDLLGGLMFSWAMATPPTWCSPWSDLCDRVNALARAATNPISAALLDDMTAGRSYRVLHELFDALAAAGRASASPTRAPMPAPAALLRAAQALLNLGASSGADMLCGVLLALTGPPEVPCPAAALPPARPLTVNP